eukprot:6056215-Alexandrium_andersonii.AAC.1
MEGCFNDPSLWPHPLGPAPLRTHTQEEPGSGVGQPGGEAGEVAGRHWRLAKRGCAFEALERC